MSDWRDDVLSVGTKPGPYEIVAPIGAGGTAEVYRARLGLPQRSRVPPRNRERVRAFAEVTRVMTRAARSR